jgi:hypothetical protein
MKFFLKPLNCYQIFKFDRSQILPFENRVTGILLHPYLSRVFLCKESKISISDILNNGKILVVRLPQSVIGSQAVNVLGSLFFNLIDLEARATKLSKGFSLVVDEFQRFAALNVIEAVLCGGRKYNLNVRVAHQNLAQVGISMRSILDNAPVKVVFNLSLDDAEHFSRELKGLVTPTQILELSTGEAYCKIGPHVTSVRTKALAAGDEEKRRYIMENSIKKYYEKITGKVSPNKEPAKLTVRNSYDKI